MSANVQKRRPSFPSVSKPAAALLPLLLLAGCGGSKPPAQSLLTVQTQVLAERSFAPGIDVVSKLESISNVLLKPETDGRVVKILASQGQRVKAGQHILVLDNVQPSAQANASKAEAATDRINAERYIFLNNQGAVSNKDRDAYITKSIQSSDQAKADKATLGYSFVKAPIDGILGDLSSVKLGDFVQKGQSITGVVDNSSLWTRMDVPSTQLGLVAVGQRVLLTSQGTPKVTAEGRVVFISPYFAPSTPTNPNPPNSLLVKAEFPNLTGKLKNGLLVTNRIITAETSTLAVPVQAVTMQASQPFVYKVVPIQSILSRLKASTQVPAAQKQKLEAMAAKNPQQPVVVQVAVQLGTLEDNYFPLVTGLSAGDRLVVSNTALLRSGMPVLEAPAGSRAGS